MGQGGKILLANKTPYRWKRIKQSSYQMAYWENQKESFPQYIEPGQNVSVYVEWDQRIGKTQSDDGGEVRYELENTSGLKFEIQASAKKGFELKILLINFSTNAIRQNREISLGWQHDGYVLFALAGTKEKLLSYTTGQPAEEWLTFIDDNTLITDLTIPGTHDSCTYRIEEGVLNMVTDDALGPLEYILPVMAIGSALTRDIVGKSAQCQTLNLTRQLEEGIRFLDIRLKNINNKLIAYHGPVPLYVNFNEICNACINFLNAHNKESVIMLVNSEDGQDISVLVKSAIDLQADYWYRGSEIPRLKDIRRRMVLMRRYNMANAKMTPDGIDCTYWPDNTYFVHPSPTGLVFDVQDVYGKFFLGKEYKKFDESVLPAMERAKKAPEGLFINFLSGSGGVYPATLANGYMTSFAGTNFKMVEHIATWKASYRLGIIPIDFPEYPAGGTLVKQLIAMNNFNQLPETPKAASGDTTQEQVAAT